MLLLLLVFDVPEFEEFDGLESEEKMLLSEDGELELVEPLPDPDKADAGTQTSWPLT